MLAGTISSMFTEEVAEFLTRSGEVIIDGMQALYEALENQDVSTLFLVFNSMVIMMYLHSQQQKLKQLQSELQQNNQQPLSEKQAKLERRAKKQEAFDTLATLFTSVAELFKSSAANQSELLTILGTFQNTFKLTTENQHEALTSANASQRQIIETRNNVMALNKISDHIVLRLDQAMDKLVLIQQSLLDETTDGLSQLTLSEQPIYQPSIPAPITDPSCQEREEVTELGKESASKSKLNLSN